MLIIKNNFIDEKNITLVIDYDRTLVNNKKKIMNKTLKNLLQFQKNGGQIVIASGRPYSGLIDVCNKLKISNGYIISENGARIYESSGKEIFNDLIENEDMKVALKKIEHLPLKKGIYIKNNLIVSGYTGDLGDEAKSNNMKIKEDNLFGGYDNTSKIILSETKKTTHSYYDEVYTLLKENFSIVKSSPRYIEINKKSVNKGKALEKIKHYLNSITIGIGDSDNDYEMLKKCKYKISMGNAQEKIKKISNLELLSNEEDAIGVFLEEIFSTSREKM